MNEKQAEIDKLNKELEHNQGTTAEKQHLEEKLREAELAVQDYEERLKILLASKTEDIVQEKALKEKRDNYMQLPLKDAKINAKATGWLYKTGNRNKNAWKKRFFILKDNYLFYYNTENEKKELKGKWIRLTEAKFEVVGERKKKSNVFVIHPKELAFVEKKEDTKEEPKSKKSKEKEIFYELTGSDKEDSEKWATLIKDIISTLQSVEIKEVKEAVLTKVRSLTLTKSQSAKAKEEQEKGKEPAVDAEKSKEEKPKEEKPKEEKPKDEKPKDEKPKEEKPKDDKAVEVATEKHEVHIDNKDAEKPIESRPSDKKNYKKNA